VFCKLGAPTLTTALALIISIGESEFSWAQVGEIKAHAPPLTLEQLVNDSDKIVQGKVEQQSVSVKAISDGKQEVPTPIYQIKFRVDKVLKGSVQPGEVMDISQWANIAQPVKEGDELLLYLPPKSRFGLSSPVGIYSGQFKIMRSSKDSDQTLAVNLNNNVGLWSDKEPLYTSFPKINFQSLDSSLSDKTAHIRAQVIDEASKPNRPGPVSVDLITSATKALTGM
jgi:hypothetical protein